MTDIHIATHHLFYPVQYSIYYPQHQIVSYHIYGIVVPEFIIIQINLLNNTALDISIALVFD